MKTSSFTLALVAAVAASIRGTHAKGTTGHYDNSFGHAGEQDHDHEDHIYGYDSVKVDMDLDTGDNQTIFDAITPLVGQANQDRVDRLTEIHERRLFRLGEQFDDTIVKI